MQGVYCILEQACWQQPPEGHCGAAGQAGAGLFTLALKVERSLRSLSLPHSGHGGAGSE
jgi:hypothetical protein